MQSPEYCYDSYAFDSEGDYIMYGHDEPDSDSDPESREIDYPNTPDSSDSDYNPESDYCYHWRLPCEFDKLDEYPDMDDDDLDFSADRSIIYAQNMESITKLQQWLRRQITSKRIRQLQRSRSFMQWYYAPQNPGGIIAKRQLDQFHTGLQKLSTAQKSAKFCTTV